jgi:hypothetical protein
MKKLLDILLTTIFIAFFLLLAGGYKVLIYKDWRCVLVECRLMKS